MAQTLFGDLVTVEQIDSDWPLDMLSLNKGQVEGYRVIADVLDGWDNSANASAITTSYGRADGVRAARRFPNKEKYLTLGGAVACSEDDRATADRIKDRLNATFDNTTLLRLTRRSPGRARYMEVRAYGSVEYDPSTDFGYAYRWMVTLMAPWPFKRDPDALSQRVAFYPATSSRYWRTYPRTYPMTYKTDAGTDTSRLTSWSFVNAGNAEAFPQFEVHGTAPANTWLLQEMTTGRSMSFNVPVAEGQVLTIDTLNKSALLDGTAVQFAKRGDWLTARPNGESVFQLFSSQPDTTMYVVGHAESTWR